MCSRRVARKQVHPLHSVCGTHWTSCARGFHAEPQAVMVNSGPFCVVGTGGVWFEPLASGGEGRCDKVSIRV